MGTKNIVIIDAPSNLGLRPPKEGSVPGCYKMPWALRNAGLIESIQAQDGGCVIPPRYAAEWQPGHHTRNSEALLHYSKTLASRLEFLLSGAAFPVVIGGDCSLIIAAGLALKRRGRYGLVFLDAHSDFRHQGNSHRVDAAAGEDLAISLGMGDPRLINIDGRGPNFFPQDVAVLGIRHFDEHLEELESRGIWYATSSQLLADFERHVETAVRRAASQTEGFWIHLDFDVLDADEMYAADCPEKDGLSFSVLLGILGNLVHQKQCIGLELTIYDPDLDPNEKCAESIVSCLKFAFSN